MPNPKRRHTRSRRDSRRASNWRISKVNTIVCPSCGAGCLPHHICSSCGSYGGEVILPPKPKKSKKKASGE